MHIRELSAKQSLLGVPAPRGWVCPVFPYQTSIMVFSERGRLIKTVETDSGGVFFIDLKPATYTLVPRVPPEDSGFRYPYASSVSVTVEFKEFRSLTIRYSNGAFQAVTLLRIE
jgi:hypothetical protein